MLLFFCWTSNAQQQPDSTFVLVDSLSIATIDSLKTDTIVQSSDDLKSKIIYNSADSIAIDMENDRMIMYNKASILYEDLDLKADYIEIDFNKRMLYAKGLPDSSGTIVGMPVFKQGEDNFNVESILYNFDTKRGKITDARTQQGEGYIHGEKIVKTESDNFYIRNGYFTTCDKVHPDFYIKSKELKIVKKKNGNQIITGPAYMTIGDVPTPLAVPFGFFPADKGRKSGLIFPSYGESAQLGFFLKEGGWYFGINDYVDASLTGDIYSLGSWALHGTSNYANRYAYSGNVGINYSVTKQNEKESPDYQKSNNFFIIWNHRQDPKANPGSVFSASVSAGSANYYQNNITTGLNYLTNTFSSSISYSKNWNGKYNLSLAARESQNNITKIYDITLPEIGFGISRIAPFKKKIFSGPEKWYEKIGFTVTTNARNQITAPDSLLFNNDAVNRFQNGMITSIPIGTSFQVLKYFTLSPSLNFNSKWYAKTFEQVYNADSNKVFIDTINGFKTANEFSTSLSLNTRVYGMANFRKGKIAAIRHVVSPSVSLSYRPDYSQEKFGYYKSVQTSPLGNDLSYSIFGGSTPQGQSYSTIYGGPSSGKYGFLSFGVDNIVDMKVRQYTDTAINLKKVKILEGLSFNSGYNFAVTEFNWSVLQIAARTSLLDRLSLNVNGTLDPYAIDPNTGFRIDVFEHRINNKFFRFTNGTAALGYSISSSNLTGVTNSETTAAKPKEKEEDEYFKIPWNVTFSYSYNYNKSGLTTTQSQTLYAYGDFSMTEKWKINFATGWDFVAKGVSYTQIGIVRDLHCWEMRFNWVPFGLQQNYYFTINVKASMLQDLKLNKKKDQYDQ